MYKLYYTNKFLRQAKKCEERGYDMNKLREVLDILVNTGTLPPQYRPHKLTGDYQGYWECHIRPDWLLAWQQDKKDLIIVATNTGTHSDLFGKKNRR